MVLIIISGNKREIEQFNTSNPIRLDRKTDYEIASTQFTLWYSLHNISDQFKTIRLNTGKNQNEWVSDISPNGLYGEEGRNDFLTRYFNSSKYRCLISI